MFNIRLISTHNFLPVKKFCFLSYKTEEDALKVLAEWAKIMERDPLNKTRPVVTMSWAIPKLKTNDIGIPNTSAPWLPQRDRPELDDASDDEIPWDTDSSYQGNYEPVGEWARNVTTNLRILHLPVRCDVDLLADKFRQFGKVVDVTPLFISKDKYGYCYILFDSLASSMNARNTLNGTQFCGCKLSIEYIGFWKNNHTINSQRPSAEASFPPPALVAAPDPTDTTPHRQIPDFFK